MITNIEKSVKASVKKSAEEQNMNTANLWQLIVMERLLARISSSNFKEHFILKGGMLLTNYIQLERETHDLDFLIVKLQNNQQKLIEVFQKIIQIDLSDHFVFSNIKIDQLSHPHMAYKGSRVKMNVHFGNIRFKISVDIGFEDVVKSSEKIIKLCGLKSKHIPRPEISLKCYPPEFIFAEKLHAISFLGGMNSRMKDYYDLYLMIQESNLLGKSEIHSILKMVFIRRKTKLEIPLVFNNYDINNLQNHWVHFHRQLGKNIVNKKSLPKDIKIVIDLLNKWLIETSN